MQSQQQEYDSKDLPDVAITLKDKERRALRSRKRREAMEMKVERKIDLNIRLGKQDRRGKWFCVIEAERKSRRDVTLRHMHVTEKTSANRYYYWTVVHAAESFDSARTLQLSVNLDGKASLGKEMARLFGRVFKS